MFFLEFIEAMVTGRGKRGLIRGIMSALARRDRVYRCASSRQRNSRVAAAGEREEREERRASCRSVLQKSIVVLDHVNHDIMIR